MAILNINVFLDLLHRQDQFKEYCLQHFSEIRADIISFTENPNCGCKKRIVDYLNKHIQSEKVLQVIEKWKNDYPQIVVTESDINTQQTNFPSTIKQPKVMVGHIIEIPAHPLEYKKFIEMSNKEQWIFRGISVLEKETEKGKVWYLFLF